MTTKTKFKFEIGKIYNHRMNKGILNFAEGKDDYICIANDGKWVMFKIITISNSGIIREHFRRYRLKAPKTDQYVVINKYCTHGEMYANQDYQNKYINSNR